METPKWLTGLLLTFILFGSISLLSVCAWVIREYEMIQSLVGSSNIILEEASFCGIAGGVIAAITTLWALCGIQRLDKCILGGTIAGLLVTTCLEIVTVTMAFTFLGQFDQQYGEVAVGAIKRHYRCTTTEAATVTTAWDELQSSNHCCGFYNGTDYEDSFFDKTTFNLQPWPSSCCIRQAAGVNTNDCLQSENTTASFAATGCKDYLSTSLNTYSLAIGLTALLLVIGQIPYLVLSLLAMRKLLTTEVEEQLAKPVRFSSKSAENVYYNV